MGLIRWRARRSTNKSHATRRSTTFGVEGMLTELDNWTPVGPVWQRVGPQRARARVAEEIRRVVDRKPRESGAGPGSREKAEQARRRLEELRARRRIEIRVDSSADLNVNRDSRMRSIDAKKRLRGPEPKKCENWPRRENDKRIRVQRRYYEGLRNSAQVAPGPSRSGLPTSTCPLRL